MENELLSIRISGAGAYYSRLVYKNDGVSIRRTVRYFELELPLESMGVSYFDGKAYPVEKNKIVCAKPGQVRYSALPYSCRYLHLRVSDAFVSACLTALPQRITVADQESYRAKFEQIAALSESKSERDALLATSLILSLIYDLQSEAQSTAKVLRHGKTDAVQAAIDYIRADITRDLRLHAVADAVFLNPTYLHGLFIKRTGVTLRAYVEEARIRRATELLTQTSLTLAEIAYACGFSSQSYFSYVFKNRRGVTPRRYAQMMSERYPLQLTE